MTTKEDDTPHQASNTHVSFVPPPWLELTTSEPLRIATRVRPPGVILLPCGDISTKGRRSTWRGASPALVKNGTVASASVGCASTLRGFASRLARKAAVLLLSCDDAS